MHELCLSLLPAEAKPINLFNIHSNTMYPPFFFIQRTRDREKYFPGAWTVLSQGNDIYGSTSALSQTDVPIFFFNKLNKCDLLGNNRSFPQWLSSKESICNAGDAGDVGLIPRLGRSPAGGHGNPFQYSGLESPMDRGAGWGPWGCKESDTTDATVYTLTGKDQ